MRFNGRPHPDPKLRIADSCERWWGCWRSYAITRFDECVSVRGKAESVYWSFTVCGLHLKDAPCTQAAHKLFKSLGCLGQVFMEVAPAA